MDQTRRKPVTEQARQSARKKLERGDTHALLSFLHSGTSTSA